MSNRFQVNLAGVVDLLSNHLYSTPEVFVRELLQNGVDAATAQRAIDPSHAGRLRIELVEPASGGGATGGTLTVEDDGVGLSGEEMHAFLATIGASSKKSDVGKARQGFLGQFGVGILACFMVSDEIVVLSRKRGGAPVEWRGRVDGTYGVRELSADLSPGTRVIITCRPGCEEFFEFERLHDIAERYGRMLPIDITLSAGNRSRAVNDGRFPWRTGATAAAGADTALEWAEGELGFRPLDVVDLSDGALGLSGGAFILDREARPGANAGHRLYLKGMFVGEQAEGLVPEWAFFVRCVVNASGLRPTASREAFVKDRALARASSLIGDRIKAHLVGLARRDPGRLRRIMAVHDLALRGLALHDDDFFEVVIDLMEFETSLGPIRFGQFRRDNHVLNVAVTTEQYNQVAGVAAAHGVRVFNGGYTHHAELLEMAAGRFDDLTLVAVGPETLIQWLPEQDETASAEMEAFVAEAGSVLAPFGCSAEARRFKPADVPVLLSGRADSGFRRSVDRSAEIADAGWGEVLGSLGGGAGSASGPAAHSVLCFNLGHPLTAQLAGLRDPPLRADVVRLLYVQALLLGRQPLSQRELGVLTGGLTGVIQRAVRPGGRTDREGVS